MIYFDNAATTLLKPEGVRRKLAYAAGNLANPGRGGHPAAMEAQKEVYACRELAATLFEAEPEQVCFTLNATHALNIAIHTLVKEGSRVVISGYEHNAVTRPLYARHAQVITAKSELFHPEQTLQAFGKAIKPQTAAVIVNHVSNVFGCIQPVEAIAQLCHDRGVPLIVDASQSAGVLPVSLKKLQAAFIAMPGHKSLYGPQGTGILLCGQLPEPVLQGGTGSMSENQSMPDFLPDRIEAGTLNVPGICGLEEGLRFVLKSTTDGILREEQFLTQQLTEQLRELPRVQVFAGGEKQTGVLSFRLKDIDCEEAAELLAEEGIALRAGLHCAPMAHSSAGTLSTGTIRVSFSAFNEKYEVERFLHVLKKLFF